MIVVGVMPCSSLYSRCFSRRRSVSAIARRVGVQPASVYGHVRDLAAIRDGVHLLALSELADRIGDAVAGRSGRAALAAMADAHRAYARERPGAWEALQRPATAATAASAPAARVASLTLAVLRGYDLAGDDAIHATRIAALAPFASPAAIAS